MKYTVLAAAAAALVVAACGQGGEKAANGEAAPAAGAPVRLEAPAPGLWRVTMDASAMPGAPAVPPTETCLKTSSFDDMQGAQNDAAKKAGADCTAGAFTRDGDALTNTVTCKMQGMTTTTTSRVTGDLSRNYTMAITTKMDPAPMPSMAETTMTMTAERIGDC